VIELPILEWSIAPTLTFQYATLMHGHPIVNGYSGYGSTLQEFLGGPASPFNDPAAIGDALDVLRAVGVRYIVAHPRDYADQSFGAEIAAAIRSHDDVASETFRSEDVVAFTLRGMAGPVAETGVPSAQQRLGPADFHATASDANDRLPLAFDGDGDTRWLTGRAQNGDEWIALHFDRPRDVARLDLEVAARSFGDYPRALTIESAGEDGAATVLYRGPMIVPYARALATGRPLPAIALALPPNRTTTLTIRQTGRTRRWFWSIHELAIFER
jgi:hypothetical protein